MIPRILEPEVMDTPEEAVDYNTMDHSHVNRVFVDDLLAALSRDQFAGVDAVGLCEILDVGTGTALIPIELCRRQGPWLITGVDLASEMLKVAAENVAAAGLGERILLRRLDAKQLPFAGGAFRVVISNSIVHHIPDPQECLAEMVRVVSPGGSLFVRDLLRPPTTEVLERFVTMYAGDENDHQRQMFCASLHAALTLDEVRSMVAPFTVPGDCVQQTSDRHWTLAWRR
jgi:2-polyprenyl-3-methyl-5-hydroxy-6-metoxy-1,4-benzoquinol methylase